MSENTNVDLSKLSISEDAKNQLTLLMQRYKTMLISKKELALELGISYSSVENYIDRGYGVPKYKQLGTPKNAKIVFNLIDIAEFLAEKTEVA